MIRFGFGKILLATVCLGSEWLEGRETAEVERLRGQGGVWFIHVDNCSQPSDGRETGQERKTVIRRQSCK